MDKSAKVLMAETVLPTPDRMFVEIRYKPFYMETYMVKQIISPAIKLFNLAEIFICKQKTTKFLPGMGASIKIKENLILAPDLALSSTLIGSNYPCLELIFMVPKVFEPLKFYCIPCNRCFDWSGWCWGRPTLRQLPQRSLC